MVGGDGSHEDRGEGELEMRQRERNPVEVAVADDGPEDGEWLVGTQQPE